MPNNFRRRAGDRRASRQPCQLWKEQVRAGPDEADPGDQGETVAAASSPRGLIVTRMKHNQAALGVALHFLARRPPFGSFKAQELVVTVARQISTQRYIMAFEGSQLVGFLGWELYGEDAAVRFARTLVPPRPGEEGGDDVVWLLLAAATRTRALRLMCAAGRRLYPGRRVMGVRHRPGGKPVVVSSRIPPPQQGR